VLRVFLKEPEHTSAYVSIRQHTSAYVSIRLEPAAVLRVFICIHTSHVSSFVHTHHTCLHLYTHITDTRLPHSQSVWTLCMRIHIKRLDLMYACIYKASGPYVYIKRLDLMYACIYSFVITDTRLPHSQSVWTLCMRIYIYIYI
jgi:hypothetical protein